MPIERVNGVDLHYLQSGDGDDVLLLCGLGDDVTAWDAQVGPFGERYRVTVVDNRGAGRCTSSRPPTRGRCSRTVASTGSARRC